MDDFDAKVLEELGIFLQNYDSTDKSPEQIVNGIGSVLNYMLSFRIPASVQFPLTQSSMLVVVTVMSLILYQEKPDKATVLSLLISIASIVLISI